MSLYNVVDKSGVVHGVDPENKVRRVIVAAKEDTEVFPMLNDYNPRRFAVAWGNDRQKC